jgi:hypothetical protein
MNAMGFGLYLSDLSLFVSWTRWSAHAQKHVSQRFWPTHGSFLQPTAMVALVAQTDPVPSIRVRRNEEGP